MLVYSISMSISRKTLFSEQQNILCVGELSSVLHNPIFLDDSTSTHFSFLRNLWVGRNQHFSMPK